MNWARIIRLTQLYINSMKKCHIWRFFIILTWTKSPIHHFITNIFFSWTNFFRRFSFWCNILFGTVYEFLQNRNILNKQILGIDFGRDSNLEDFDFRPKFRLLTLKFWTKKNNFWEQNYIFDKNSMFYKKLDF